MSKRLRTVGSKSLVAQQSSRSGRIITCPYCRDALSNSESGVKGHLRKHVNDGSLKAEDALSKCYEILERPLRINKN